MARKSKKHLAAGLVLTLAAADAVGIYIAKNKLGKAPEIGPRELAVANEPLSEPIAIRTNGELRETPALAMSAIAPRAAQAPATAQAEPRTVRVAIPEPVRVRETARPVATVAVDQAARRPLARQLAPVVTGVLATTAKPVRRPVAERRAAAPASRQAQVADLRVHQQRIPVRATRFERAPARADAFATAFSDEGEDIRLPEPAFSRGNPLPQASAELPPLELSASQIHSDHGQAPDADIPAAPPATAGSDEISPRS